jgi:signal transduction histidine kinase
MQEIDGSVAGIIVLGVDITDRKNAVDALLNTEKLAAVGRLAASIAHEINNPLSSVTNLIYLARHSNELNEVHEFLDTAERELRRVSVISNQTLRFHRQSTKQQAVRSEELFESVLSIYQGRLVNSSIAVQRRFRAQLPITCFDGEIRQVLNNLVGNAIDAMHSSGGTLSVRTRETRNWQTGARGITLTVADTGTGMSPEVLEKIFEPFFTTKGIGGTGLGLWICTEIVNRHHGLLRVKSSAAKAAHGTVFTLFLPFGPPVR